MTTDTEYVLERAVEAFDRLDTLRAQRHAIDAEINALCRAFDDAAGTRGIRPERLRAMIVRALA
jgi:hypothetical protein